MPAVRVRVSLHGDVHRFLKGRPDPCTLELDDGATVDAVALNDKGLVPDLKLPVKILGEGEITKKLTVVAGWYSKSAHEKITQAGGAAQNLKGETFAFPKPKKKFIPREGAAKGGKKKKEEAPVPEGAIPAPAPAAPAAAVPAPAAETPKGE